MFFRGFERIHRRAVEVTEILNVFSRRSGKIEGEGTALDGDILRRGTRRREAFLYVILNAVQSFLPLLTGAVDPLWTR